MLVSLPEGKFFSPIPWFLLSRHDLLHFASSSSASNFQLSKRFPSRSFLTRAPDSGLTFPQRPIFWDENRPKQRWNASKNHWKPTIHFSFTYLSLSVPVFLLKIIHFACDIQLFAGEIHIYLATLKFAILFMPFYSTPSLCFNQHFRWKTTCFFACGFVKTPFTVSLMVFPHVIVFFLKNGAFFF